MSITLTIGGAGEVRDCLFNDSDHVASVSVMTIEAGGKFVDSHWSAGVDAGSDIVVGQGSLIDHSDIFVGRDLTLSGNRCRVRDTSMSLSGVASITISGDKVSFEGGFLGTNQTEGTEAILVSGDDAKLHNVRVRIGTGQTTDLYDLVLVTGDRALISDLIITQSGADKYKDVISIDAAAAGTTIGALALDSTAIAAGVVVNDAGTDTVDLHVETIAYALAGNLAVKTGALRLPVTQPGILIDSRVMVDTAPTGASAIFDVLLNGTTVYGTATNPTIAIAANDSGFAPVDVGSVVAVGDYLTINIDQIGSTVPGADVVLLIRYRVQQ